MRDEHAATITVIDTFIEGWSEVRSRWLAARSGRWPRHQDGLRVGAVRHRSQG